MNPLPKDSELLEAALSYVARGWHVIPLHTVYDGTCTCGCKDPTCKTRGKHPRLSGWSRDGLVDAAMISKTIDPEYVIAWWHTWPDANIGVLTGEVSGIVVTDVDKPHRGYESWGALRTEYGPLADTPVSNTGSGGSHLIYKHPGYTIRNKAPLSPTLDGIDFRGDGGFFVAPPSHNAEGVYEWDLQYHPDDTDIAELPYFIRHLHEGQQNGNGKAEPIPEVIGGGTRNTTLTSLAGSMRRRGLDEDTIFYALCGVNDKRCDPTLDEREVRKIAHSIARYPPGEDYQPANLFGVNGHSTNGTKPPDAAEADTDTEKPTGLRMVCIADVKSEPIDWLWEGFIARRKFGLWEGDPGVGKTFALLAISAALTRGFGLPGMDYVDEGNVMLFTVEDDLADTIRPRLDTLGADVSRFFAYDEPMLLDSVGLQGMDAEMTRLQPSLVIIDPIMAYIPGKLDVIKPNHIRTVTTPLRMLAKKHNCAVVGIRHLTKGEKQKAIYRGSGGMDWVAASRLVVLVGDDPDSPGYKAIVQTKTNIGTKPEAVSFTLDNGVFEWAGRSEVTAEKILDAKMDSSDAQDVIEDAKVFLTEVLAEGPKRSTDLVREAQQMGINKTALWRASRRMPITKSRHNEGPRGKGYWMWALIRHNPTLTVDE